MSDGGKKFAYHKGVNVGVKRTNGTISTIFPTHEQPERNGSKTVKRTNNSRKNDVHSYHFDEIFEEKRNILCENLQETMQFIDSCTQEEFYWISNAFEDISVKYKSQEFIDCLRRNRLRFLEIHNEIEQEIQNAIFMIYN